MNVSRTVLWVALLGLVSCRPEETTRVQGGTPQEITNRLRVTPDVVNNLGITFETATRGRLGLWREVPGELEVPDGRRWILRAPARGRLIHVVPRWQRVEKDAELATLASPGLQEAQREIELAERTREHATEEYTAARARLDESELHSKEAESFERASRKRLEELQEIGRQGNPLTAGEILVAHGIVTDASKARLEAAITRDELVSRVALHRLEADQARLSVDERLSALAVLTGLSVEELKRSDDHGPAWRRIEALTMRAPAAGVVVEILASRGEILEAGDPILRVFDTRELRFRGHLPEGDLGTLHAGNRVRLEFPSRRRQTVETRLEAPLPVADPQTRMIHVEAVVPNADGALAHGLSVMAQVLVEESESEEVLIPIHCVVFDRLEAIVFQRDANDPNVVIRTPVELGARAAGKVEVLAGVLDGDSLVADGIQQLKQTGLGRAPEGGHFHADGTWHSDHE